MNNNAKAFLGMISACEGSTYKTLYGGGTFESFADHPRRSVTAGGYTSTAAGAYQILASTWDAFVKANGTHLFYPEDQDACALWLIQGRGALGDVEEGRLASAIAKCNKEWASLPGSPYGQPTRSYAYCEQHYLAAGGVLHPQGDVQPAAPIEDHSTTLPPQQPTRQPMGAALALLPLVAQFIPQIMTLIKPGSASTAKDAAVAQTILNTVVQAAGVVSNGPATAQSVGAAVDAMSADPELAKSVQNAVVTHPDVIGLLEIGAGGISAAREANANPSQIPFYKNPGFVIAGMLIPLIYIVVSRVMFADGYSEQLKTVVVTAILSGLLGALTGFYFGSSLSSARKDDALAAK
jgi:muramidase (phage lysozyme)